MLTLSELLKNIPKEEHQAIVQKVKQLGGVQEFQEWTAQQSTILQARQDYNMFCKYCFVDEYGEPWDIQQHQEDWYELAEAHDRLIIFSPIETAKSKFFSMAYPIWKLGHNHKLRMFIMSDTSSQAEDMLQEIKLQITENDKLHKVFPELKPATDKINPSRPLRWSATSIIVNRELKDKTPSISVAGIQGPILGKRLELVILDDILTEENTRTPHRIETIVKKIENEILSRLVQGGQLVWVGTAWRKNDPQHMFSEREGFYCERYSLVKEDEKLGHTHINWPAQWPPERIEKKRTGLGTASFNRSIRCIALTSEDLPFMNLMDDIASTTEEAVQQTFTGVDLSSGSRKGNAIVDIGVLSNGKRQVLDVEVGSWSGKELPEKIRQHYERYDSSIVKVESNSIQKQLLELFKDLGYSDVPLQGFVTGKNKADLTNGVPGLAIDIENDNWIIDWPDHHQSCECDWCRFKKEMKYYPDYKTSDIVMAWWFAREAARSMNKSQAKLHRFDRKKKEYVQSSITHKSYYAHNRLSQLEAPNKAIINWLKQYTDLSQAKEQVQSGNYNLQYSSDAIMEHIEDMQLYVQQVNV